MSLPDRGRRVLRVLGAAGLALLLLVVALGIAAFVGVTVPLDGFRGQAEQAASRALGRRVTLEGDLEAQIGFDGRLLSQRIRVANPEGWEGYLLELGHVHVDVSLLSLLRRELYVRELVARDAALALEERAPGVSNWIATGPPRQGGDASTGRLSFIGFDRVAVEEFEVTLDRADGSSLALALESLTGRVRPASPCSSRPRVASERNLSRSGSPRTPFAPGAIWGAPGPARWRSTSQVPGWRSTDASDSGRKTAMCQAKAPSCCPAPHERPSGGVLSGGGDCAFGRPARRPSLRASSATEFIDVARSVL